MLLNRRDFIKTLAAGGAVLALNPVLFAQRYAQKTDPDVIALQINGFVGYAERICRHVRNVLDLEIHVGKYDIFLHVIDKNEPRNDCGKANRNAENNQKIEYIESRSGDSLLLLIHIFPPAHSV